MSDPTPAGPTRRALGWLALAVLVLHLALLIGVASPLSVQLRTEPQVSALQMRVITPPPVVNARPASRAPVRQPQASADASDPQPKKTEPSTDPAPEPAPEEATLAAPDRQTNEQPPREETATAIQALPPAPVSATAWPLMSLGALPSSRVLNYQLTGMDRGLNYQAAGELRWQHNDSAYELTLSVRAFLLGRRQWRSAGRIDASGLAPVRFSDIWRNERAAHFDRSQQRIVFSSNSTPAALEPGAQDQISLYVQLAAAMAGEPERYEPGTRLQVQTVTVRDALPWSLVLEGGETMTIEGQSLKVLKWVCQPRNRFEARVEFWVAPEHAWLPLRIRITQTSGSFIDLVWRGMEPLPPLPSDGQVQ